MADDGRPTVIIKELGRGAQAVTPYGEPGNRAGEVKSLRTRINAPATRRGPKAKAKPKDGDR